MKFRWLALGLTFLFACQLLQAVEPEKLSLAFRERMIEAIMAYRKKDFATAAAKIEEAERVQPNTTAAANMRGAIAMESDQYEVARTSFERALTIDPDFFPARFNLCEIPFQQKEYSQAREMYLKLPTKDSAQSELVQYKIFMTYLLEKKEKEAEEVLETIKFPSDTPVKSASRIFKPHENLIYAETLEELGWLKRNQVPQEESAF